MAGSRNTVFNALYALTQHITWLDGATTVGWATWDATTGRRIPLYDEVDLQPAIFQGEFDEDINQVTNMPYRQILSAVWVVYHNSGDPKTPLGPINNTIVEACIARLAPAPTDPGFRDRRNTLGGLVYHCFVQGKVEKMPGDIDRQAMLCIPIKLLVP